MDAILSFHKIVCKILCCIIRTDDQGWALLGTELGQA